MIASVGSIITHPSTGEGGSQGKHPTSSVVMKVEKSLATHP